MSEFLKINVCEIICSAFAFGDLISSCTIASKDSFFWKS